MLDRKVHRCALAVAAACVLVFGPSLSAQAADETAISFSGAGTPTYGFGDLEQNVRDTSSNHTDWSVFSTVNAGTAYCANDGSPPPCSPGVNTEYLPDVQSDMGYTAYATAPLTVNYSRQLNAVHDQSDPVSGGYGTLDWVHETATATWAPPGDPGGGTHGTWYTMWQTYPRAGPEPAGLGSCGRPGDGIFGLGWIGFETFPNDSSVSYPLPPAQGSLPSTETRLFAGSAWKYSTDPDFAARIDSTSGWATGQPARPPTGLTSDPYVAWSEPSLLYDNGTLLVAMTGLQWNGTYDAYGCQVYVGDVWLFSYTFSTSTWNTGCELIDHSVASSPYSYFTAASLFWDPSTPGQIDMVVSPVHEVAGTGGPVDIYNGEALFGLSGSGGCPSAVYAGDIGPVSPYESDTTFIGAGGFLWSAFDNSSTVEFQMHKYCTSSGVFKVGAWVSGSFHDVC